MSQPDSQAGALPFQGIPLVAEILPAKPGLQRQLQQCSWDTCMSAAKISVATETLGPNISAWPTHSCHWGELHRVYWWVGQVHSCYVLVSHALYQVLPFPNKGKLTLCLDNVLGKTYFQLIAPTVTPQASTLESPKAVQNEVVFAQLCQGSCASTKKWQTWYAYLDPCGPKISYSHLQLSNDLIGLVTPILYRI